MFKIKIEISGENLKDVIKELCDFRLDHFDNGNDFKTEIRNMRSIGGYGDADIKYEVLENDTLVDETILSDVINRYHINDDPDMPPEDVMDMNMGLSEQINDINGTITEEMIVAHKKQYARFDDMGFRVWYINQCRERPNFKYWYKDMAKANNLRKRHDSIHTYASKMN